MSIRITNLIASTSQIQQHIDKLAMALAQSDSNLRDIEVENILQNILQITAKVNRLCEKRGGSPEDLPTPSFRAYQWLKFLGQRKWLLNHLYTQADFYGILLEVFPSLAGQKMGDMIRVEIGHSGYLFRSLKTGRLVILQINEGFLNAPREIKKTIIEAALQRRTKARLDAIRAYAASAEYAKIHSALQTNNGQNQLAGSGKVYDLPALFREINEEYFKGEMSQPRLTWSARGSLRRLGTYQPDGDTISISRRLDNRDVPKILVAYVLYHEMLHKKLGLKEVNGRRYAHTSTFRKLEKQFKGFEEAERIMKDLNKR
jgi:predicted metal-dependent hydrolase